MGWGVEGQTDQMVKKQAQGPEFKLQSKLKENKGI
jgi:hypothetical protein